jgi:hypothetical protein
MFYIQAYTIQYFRKFTVSYKTMYTYYSGWRDETELGSESGLNYRHDSSILSIY